MITWTDNYNGTVGTIFVIYIAQRADELFDVECRSLRGFNRALETSIDAAHNAAAYMVRSALRDVLPELNDQESE